MNRIQKIFLKTISILLLGLSSQAPAMTLEDTPTEIKKLIIHQVIEQSENSQQARNTLAACAGISRRWGFLRADLQRARQYAQAQDKTKVEQDSISRLLREKAKQNLFRYLQNIEKINDDQFWQKMSATLWQKINAIPKTHPKTCVQNFIHNIFNRNDIMTILNILITPLVYGALPLDCLDILFEYYHINRSNTITCYEASIALINELTHLQQHPDDTIENKVKRIHTIIEKLEQYNMYDEILMPETQC